jgi:hypothetical protein
MNPFLISGSTGLNQKTSFTPPGLEGDRMSNKERLEQLYSQWEGLLGDYGDIAEHGQLGEGGIAEIMRNLEAASLRRRQNLGRGLTAAKDRTVGSRSGAIQNYLKDVYAGEFGGMNEILANLQRFNKASRTQGLQGQERITAQMLQKYLAKKRSSDDSSLWGNLGTAIGAGAALL